MRVGFAIPSLDGGGAELVARRWAEALGAAGHEVSAYTFDPKGSARLAGPGMAHRHFPFRSAAARWLLLPWWLRRQADRDGVDVLIAMMRFGNLVGLIGLRLGWHSPADLVVVEHNVMTLMLPIESGSAKAATKAWLARRLYRRADAAIGVSHAVVADLIGGYGVAADRAFVVPNPIVDSPAPRAGEPPARLNVAFVGRLTPQKRPLLFVEALAALAARGVAVRGTILGEGPLAEEARARGEALGVALEFRGWRDPWWSSAEDVDCLLLPSSAEGLGNVLVEAAAARVPSVACSSALGTADAIVPGLTGELVLGSAPERLADGVLRAVVPRDADPVRGWLDRFSVANSASLLLELLADLRPDRGAR